MPSRLETDPDLKYFAAKLQKTPEGGRYVSRWQRLASTEKELRAALESNNGTLLEITRQSYIRLSDMCSRSIQELETKYCWPPR